jgi:hypothetical protein
MKNISDARRVCETEKNSSSALLQYDNTLKYTEMKCVDSDLGQTEVAATPALPAVTRNFLAEA